MHDAHDAEGSNVLRHVEAEMVVDGVFVALEEPLYEGFVHDGHRRGGFIVGGGEVASAQDPHAEVLQIIGTDPIP